MTADAMWVFGYGSLIWNPEFPFAEKSVATLSGYVRSFCMSSVHHRGTAAEPGLVLALDKAPQGRCTGVAYRVEPGHENRTLDVLRARELISSAYVEATVPLALRDGRDLMALTYVVDRDHDQYRGGMALEEQARLIARSTGGRGPNDEYLWNTTDQLDRLGIADADLAWLARRVRDIADDKGRHAI